MFLKHNFKKQSFFLQQGIQRKPQGNMELSFGFRVWRTFFTAKTRRILLLFAQLCPPTRGI